jgi:Co/Zn/Cd efflux system component
MSSGVMVVFGIVGLLGNAVSILLLSRISSGNLNIRAALLEVVNDALGAAAVLIAAVVIAFTGWARADAFASLVIGLMILPRTWNCSARPSTCSWKPPQGRRPRADPRAHLAGRSRAPGPRPARLIGRH